MFADAASKVCPEVAEVAHVAARFWLLSNSVERVLLARDMLVKIGFSERSVCTRSAIEGIILNTLITLTTSLLVRVTGGFPFVAFHATLVLACPRSGIGVLSTVMRITFLGGREALIAVLANVLRFFGRSLRNCCQRSPERNARRNASVESLPEPRDGR